MGLREWGQLRKWMDRMRGVGGVEGVEEGVDERRELANPCHHSLQ